MLQRNLPAGFVGERQSTLA